MSWDTEMVEVLRVMVNDLDSKTYTDLTLKRTLAVAALQVSQELSFGQPFTGKPSNTDPQISPDPTDDAGGTRDESFINLCCLKAACITDRGGAILAAKQAIAVKDGTSAIDLRGVLGGKLKLLEQGWCAVYEDAKTEYLTTSAGGIAGAVVMTPFRLYAYGGFAHGNMFTSQRQRIFDYYQ